MALFSQEQLKQFQALLKPLDARLSDIDKQQGGMWETSVRQSMRDQFGHSFSKEFTIASLQHLAKIICSVGWPFGSTLWTSVASLSNLPAGCWNIALQTTSFSPFRSPSQFNRWQGCVF